MAHLKQKAGLPADYWSSAYPARWWHALDDGRIQCDLCPRDCKLHEGQRGACFVRARTGRPDGADHLRPLVGLLHRPDREEAAQPLLPRLSDSVLRHRRLQPGLQVLPELGHLEVARHGPPDGRASPEGIAAAASPTARKSVAFTYNDPVIFAEYAMDTADACHARGIKTVAVTAGYMHPARRASSSQDGRRQRRPQGLHRRLLRQALRRPPAARARHPGHIHHETDCWLEITTLLIPGKNDGDAELKALAAWVAKELGPDVPLHFSAFHPDWKMDDIPATPPATLTRARRIAMDAGLHYVYTGNVHDKAGDATSAPAAARR
jgi:pyruvate formate lyase activating enzyme